MILVQKTPVYILYRFINCCHSSHLFHKCVHVTLSTYLSLFLHIHIFLFLYMNSLPPLIQVRVSLETLFTKYVTIVFHKKRHSHRKPLCNYQNQKLILIRCYKLIHNLHSYLINCLIICFLVFPVQDLILQHITLLVVMFL